jgi:O-antigen/teichoic acid export membrane protein
VSGSPIPPGSTAATGEAPASPGAPVTARGLATGGAWTVAGRTLPLFYTFVISVAAARILGPTAMGQLALIVFTASTAMALLTIGLAGAFTRFIGESLGRGEGDAARLLVRSAAMLAVVGALVSIAAFAVVAASASSLRTAWLFAGVWTAATIVHAVPSVLLSGAQRWRQAIIVGLTTGTIHVALALGVLAAGGGVAELVAIDALVAVVNVFGTVWLARRELRSFAPVSARTRDLRGTVLRYGAVSSIALALSFVFERRGEVVFLALFSSDAQIALYTIPFSGLAVLALVPYALGTVASTAYATLLGAGNVARIQAAYERSLRLALLVTLPLTAGALVIGPPLLEAVYGEEYAGARTVLAILIAGLPLIVATSLSAALLQGLARVREQVAVYASTATANVALCLVLVPQFDAAGAATAHSLAYVVAAAGAAVATSRALHPLHPRLHLLFRTAVASVLAGLTAAVCVALLPEPTSLVAAAVAGAATFAFLARVLRVVPAEDALWLSARVPRGRRLVAAVSRPA